MLSEQEKLLIARIERIIGYVPVGTLDLIHVLTHPDVIALTKAYVESKE